MKIRFHVNGEAVAVEARADEVLLDVLRGELDLTSVRYTCGIGVCGACTALVDGEPISTCILLAPLAEGKKIRAYMGGNLCRCGCYPKIEDAVNLAASASKAAALTKGGA